VSCNHPGRPRGRHRPDLSECQVVIRYDSSKPLTNRTSPASTKGFVVNHSHMKALVDPSLTELMRPRRSLFTSSYWCGWSWRKVLFRFTLEFQLIRGPALLPGHDICHCTTTTNQRQNFSPSGTVVHKNENSCLPRREIPRMVPFRSDMRWNLEFFPVTTALLASDLGEILGDNQG
jgi:hypothetical protein